jgi:hypothetical protein
MLSLVVVFTEGTHLLIVYAVFARMFHDGNLRIRGDSYTCMEIVVDPGNVVPKKYFGDHFVNEGSHAFIFQYERNFYIRYISSLELRSDLEIIPALLGSYAKRQIISL